MKQYPSIPKIKQSGSNFYVFDKIDGSNVRAEWSKKKGFTKFGSRKVLLGEAGASDEQTLLGESIALMQGLSEPMSALFNSKGWQQVTCFFEFYGPSSFAGSHVAEPHKVSLLDINIQNKGMLDVREFLDMFQDSGIEIPKLLHHGSFTSEMEEAVKAGTLEGMTFEGVVAKAPISKKWEAPTMFKVKNLAWIAKVKQVHGEKAEYYL